MGQEAPRVATTALQIEGEIASIRRHISGLVREIDRRRIEWSGKGKRVLAVAAVVGGVLLFAGLGVAARIQRRRQARLGARIERLGHTLAVVVDRPGAVLARARSSPVRRILSGMAALMVRTAVRRLIGR